MRAQLPLVHALLRERPLHELPAELRAMPRRQLRQRRLLLHAGPHLRLQERHLLQEGRDRLRKLLTTQPMAASAEREPLVMPGWRVAS